jgi:hypothetical protein
MTQGLILLGFLAVLTVWITIRVRRRLGLPVTSKTVTTVALGFVLIVLALYALAASGH